MRFLKQSTSVDVGIGPFLDETDGKTAETALTITQPDIRLKKNGGAWAQKNAAQTLSHEENGWYEVTLDSTDTDTLGILLVAVHESGALPVWVEFQVVTANVYDSLFSTDVLDVSVTQWTGTNVAAPDTAGYPKVTHKVGTGTGEINLSSGKVPATLAVGDDWKVIRTGTAQAGGNTTITLDAGASGAVSFYNDLLVVITSGTGAGQVRLITLYDGGSKIATVETAWWTNPDNTSVFALVHASALARCRVVGAVTGAVGSVTGLTPGNLDVAISSRASQVSLDAVDDYVDTEIAAIKAKTDNLPAAPASTGDCITAAGVRTAVGLASANLDTQLSAIDDYIDTEVAAIKAKTDNLPAAPASTGDCITAAGVRTAVGLAAANLDTQLAAIDDYLDTEISAIKAKTDNLPTDPADESSIQAAIAALNNLSAAQVLTQVNTALDTAISELGVAAPTATPTIRTALMLLYMALRNKVTVTSTTKAIHNDAGTSIAGKSLTDDGTTYTEAEMA